MAGLTGITCAPEISVGPSPPVADRAAQIAVPTIDRSVLASILGGIALAGAAYPIALVAIVVSGLTLVEAFYIFAGTGATLTIIKALPEFVLVVASLVMAALVGFIMAGIVSLLVLPLANLCVRTLRVQLNASWFGAICGGLIGCFCTSLLLGDNPYSDRPYGVSLQESILLLSLGPGLASLIGQLGGAWGGKRATAESFRRWFGKQKEVASHRFQFDLRQLFWFSTWLGILLAAIHLAGLPFEFVLPVILGWLVYQAATLWVGWLVICRLWPRWRASRRGRFT